MCIMDNKGNIKGTLCLFVLLFPAYANGNNKILINWHRYGIEEMEFDNTTKYCQESCDDWLCWPKTSAGLNVSMGCPRIKGTLPEATAYKYCTPNGTWESRLSSNGSLVEFTHYEGCIIPQLQDLSAMCTEFGIETCGRIAKNTRIIEIVGLSFSAISLIVSLYIFFEYRILKNNRTKIHKNLFIATLLQVIVRLIIYIDQGLDGNEKFLSTDYYLYEICTSVMEYAKTAMFMWMFIEGLYLHNMITVTVFQEYLHINIYIYAGWIVPALMTTVWLIVMISKEVRQTWPYYFFLPYYWILEGPRSGLIIVNLLFLINIVRVLVVKLKQSRTSEIQQVKKAVRAALFLLPLMGTAHILFLVDYRVKRSWIFAFWSYVSYFLNTFQGFFVAVLYCFLNGEVQTAVRNSFYLRMSLRNYDYSACRNFTLISGVTLTTTNGDLDTNNSGEGPICLKCCHQPPQSPEEKEINICDINGRRNTKLIAVTVEQIPMVQKTYSVRSHENSNNSHSLSSEIDLTPKDDDIKDV